MRSEQQVYLEKWEFSFVGTSGSPEERSDTRLVSWMYCNCKVLWLWNLEILVDIWIGLKLFEAGNVSSYVGKQ